LTIRPVRPGDRRLRATCRQEFDRPYFLDLVVDFLLVDFLPELFEPDLLDDFFAMALTSFLERQIYGSDKKPSTFFFGSEHFFRNKGGTTTEARRHGGALLLPRVEPTDGACFGFCFSFSFSHP
jgi:hypothetical protein